MNPSDSHARAKRCEGFFCGVDVGASWTKLVIWDAQSGRRVNAKQRSGMDYQGAAESCLKDALAKLQLSATDIRSVVATGYGRESVPFAKASRTEIQCQQVGCHREFSRALTVLDIGSQDIKIVWVDVEGRGSNFKINRSCAAGTGVFLEEIALRLGCDVETLPDLAQRAPSSVSLSSFCTVFAKNEVIGHLRRGASAGSIAQGAYRAVVDRVMELDPLDGHVVFTGGVAAHHPMVVQILQSRLHRAIEVPAEPLFTAAFGAAVQAAEIAEDEANAG